MAALDDILAGYEALRPALYQDLHRHPELSHLSGHLAFGAGTAATFWLLTKIF